MKLFFYAHSWANLCFFAPPCNPQLITNSFLIFPRDYYFFGRKVNPINETDFLSTSFSLPLYSEFYNLGLGVREYQYHSKILTQEGIVLNKKKTSTENIIWYYTSLTISYFFSHVFQYFFKILLVIQKS